MINNRQAGRRNRGRNNGRPNNGNNRNNGENGNRIDNRARGNAPQLLEKYRNLARDAQLAGDRVNTEYYLQFADHYFRVIADNRARQEEQQARYRRPDEAYEDEGERYSSYDDGFAPTEADRHQASQPRAEREDGFGSSEVDGVEPEQQERPRRDQREQRQPRGGREQREPRERFQRNDQRPPREDRPRRVEAQEQQDPVAREEQPQPEPQADAPRARRGRPRRAQEDTAESPGLDLAVLPPSISRADNDSALEVTAAPEPMAEEAPAPKRRGRPRKVVAEAAE